jgi:hypothetical protein
LNLCLHLCLWANWGLDIFLTNLVSVVEESPGISSRFVELLGLGGRNQTTPLFPKFKDSDWPMDKCHSVFLIGGIWGICWANF